MHPSTTGRCGEKGRPIEPFSGGKSGSIRAHCSSVNIAVVDMDRQSGLQPAQEVRHALVGLLLASVAVVITLVRRQ